MVVYWQQHLNKTKILLLLLFPTQESYILRKHSELSTTVKLNDERLLLQVLFRAYNTEGERVQLELKSSHQSVQWFSLIDWFRRIGSNEQFLQLSNDASWIVGCCEPLEGKWNRRRVGEGSARCSHNKAHGCFAVMLILKSIHLEGICAV